jgi:hypothetical protein
VKVFVVTESDYDDTWIVAVYPTRELADEHERLMGGHVEESEVLEALHPDATDPAKQAEREAEARRCKEEWEQHLKEMEEAAERRAQVRPNPPRMGLCHCQTFSERPGQFWNAHGHCSYCGGFAPDVFRENMGDAALHLEIDRLDERRRVKMREILSRTADARA